MEWLVIGARDRVPLPHRDQVVARGEWRDDDTAWLRAIGRSVPAVTPQNPRKKNDFGVMLGMERQDLFCEGIVEKGGIFD